MSDTPASTYEDLSTGEDAAAEPAAAAPAAETKIPTWQRWRVNPQTKARELETYDLLPYLRSVEDLWHRLCEGDIPIRAATDNLDAWAGAAIKLLYLLSHQPHEYRHLRSQPELFVEVIEAWGNENVPREKTLDAVTLVMRIHNSAYAV